MHQPSLEAAEKHAAESGAAGRVTFLHSSGTDYEGGPYDLICFFDALHDMGDPAAVLKHARSRLAEGGTLMVVEPMAAADGQAEGNPVARAFYASSASICTPNALSQGSTALGNQVPDETWHRIFAEAGFAHFRRATETPFNRIFEARAH